MQYANIITVFTQVVNNKSFSFLVLNSTFCFLNIHNKAISKNNKTNAKNLQAIESIRPIKDNIIDTLINNYKQFKLYQKEKEEFENKYKIFTNKNKITPNEANALRHIGASLYFGTNHGVNTAKMLGNLNEIFSYSDGSADDTKNDRKIDLYNNHIGRTQAQHYKNNITPEQAIERAMYMINYTNQPALNGNDKRVLEYKNK